MSALSRSLLLLPALLALGCAPSAGPSEKVHAAVTRGVPPASAARRGSALEQAWAAFDASRYPEAEASFRAILERGQGRARLGLASVLLMTGRYAETESVASERTGVDAATALELVAVHGEALVRQGKMDQAEALLSSAAGDPAARAARVLYGDVLLQRGKSKEAEPVLMTLIEEYNSDRIAETDSRSLGLVGRAAMLLGSPKDANLAFDDAERKTDADARTLLFRTELFLDKYDTGHAEEVLNEILARAPDHPEALVRMAEVKLASNLDFEGAEELARKALSVNPRLARAEFVLAGVALRDMSFESAEAAIARGLSTNPADLELLSLRAASRFLADDHDGFEAAKKAVLGRNPRYSRLYQILGEYAEWEHRYDELVAMMREALLADPGDAKVRAELGLNLIRAGEEKDGVSALSRAFDLDPYNVRVFNTLNLYEKDIPKSYESVSHGRFTIRYSKPEKELLDRYVPQLLERAFATFSRKYEFTPPGTVGVELYPERAHFAIRTSGLPQTFIQGVCFGRTLAAISPRKEKFNLGMTLWHELAHVFHIQLSKSRVPRWFTEGLAEYETLVARPEWRREHDAELLDALDRGKVPTLAEMNRAFTHAADMSDMATAYYASTQLVAYIAGRFGMPAVRRMLVLWGEGLRTEEVVQKALGRPPAEVDRDFRAELDSRLATYRAQFRPPSHPGAVADAERAAREAPRDATRAAELSFALLSEGKPDKARGALERALSLEPENALGLWVKALLQKDAGDDAGARKTVARLAASGHDGFAVEQALAELAGTPAERRAALEAAHRMDPQQAGPLRTLSELALAGHDEELELDSLRKLVLLEENDGDAYRRLVSLLLQRKSLEEARRVGESGVWADIESTLTHRLYAEVLLATNARKEAAAELESATLGLGTPEDVSAAHLRLATVLSASGDEQRAREHRRAAAALSASTRTGPI